MKRLKIDAARFGEAGDVRKAYSLGALQTQDPAPIVKTAEIDGRFYTVTSLGVQSADAYELRHLHDGPAAKGGEFAGRLVTRRGVGYRLHGPVKLVAAAAEAASADNAGASAAYQIPVIRVNPNEPAEPAPMPVDDCPQATRGATVAEMKADVAAQIAAARARVEAATPEQLAQKRTPLPVAVIHGPALAQAEAFPDDWRDGIDPQVGAAPLPPLVEANLALDAAALDQAPATFPVEVDDAGQFDPHAYTARVKSELAALREARQTAPETHQAPATVAEEESAASVTPQVQATPAIVCPRCREALRDGVNWHGAEIRVHTMETLTCDDCREEPAPFDAAPAIAHAGPRRLVPVDRYPYDEIALGWIVPSPHNPRRIVDDEALRELADSIRERGVLQPLRVRKIGEAEVYELIAGERRWHAARIAGLTSVPVVLSSATTEAEVRLEQLVENLQRQDLDAVQVARAYQAMAALGMTQTQIAAAVGKAQPTVANQMSILALPEKVLGQIAKGDLTLSHGQRIARFSDWPEVAAKIAEYSANGKKLNKERGTVKWLEGHSLPFEYELERAGLVKGLGWGAAFDVEACKACPFGAYYQTHGAHGHCMRPAHYAELQEAAIADATSRATAAMGALDQQRQRAGIAAPAEVEVEVTAWTGTEPALAEAGAKGGASPAPAAPDELDEELSRLNIPRIADLPHGSLVVLGEDDPCQQSDCPCRGVALDQEGEPVAVCMDSKRYHQRANQRRQAAERERVEALGRLQAEAWQAYEVDPGAQRRALALLVDTAAQRAGQAATQAALTHAGLTLDADQLSCSYSSPQRKRPLWETLATLDAPRLQALTVRILVEHERVSGSYGYGPGRLEFLAGHAVAAPVAEIVATDPGTCRHCGATTPDRAEEWPLDDLCDDCTQTLEVRGLLDEEGGDREARACEGCGERIGAHKTICPLCQATAGETDERVEAVA